MADFANISSQVTPEDQAQLMQILQMMKAKQLKGPVPGVPGVPGVQDVPPPTGPNLGLQDPGIPAVTGQTPTSMPPGASNIQSISGSDRQRLIQMLMQQAR